MASERFQRQIDRLLDQVEEAVEQFDWEGVLAQMPLGLVDYVPAYIVCTGGVKGVSPSSSLLNVPTMSVEKATGRRFEITSKNSLKVTTKDTLNFVVTVTAPGDIFPFPPKTFTCPFLPDR